MLRESWRTWIAIIKPPPRVGGHINIYTMLWYLYSEPHLVLLWQGWSEPLNVGSLVPRASTHGGSCSNLCTKSLISTPHISSGSQFTWFISTVSLFILRHRCSILFRNLQLTCCQRSICNGKLLVCLLLICTWNLSQY